MNDLVYKVRDTKTGTYQTGHGRFPHFVEDGGEVYHDVPVAKRAIKTRGRYLDDPEIEDLEIVEYKLVPTGKILRGVI